MTFYNERIKNPVKHLKWRIFGHMFNKLNSLTIFARRSILDVDKVLNTPLVYK